MKSKAEIEMDFTRAVSQADELIYVSDKLSDIAGKNSEAFSMLVNSWLGNNAGKFSEKGNLLEKEIFGTADDLKKIAENIKKTAGIVYNAEKVALQIGF